MDADSVNASGDSADASMMVVKDPSKKSRFKEHGGRTYYGQKGKVEEGKWSFSFTLNFKCSVNGTADTPAGQICSLKLHDDDPGTERVVFIRNTSWANLRDFHEDVKNCFVFTTIQPAILQKYGDWKRSQYIKDCKTRNVPQTRDAIKCLGFQNHGIDIGNAWCANPESILHFKKEMTELVADAESRFVWVPQTNDPIPHKIEIYNGSKECRLMLKLNEYLPEGTFLSFLLISGHTWLSALYKVLRPHLRMIPPLIVHGPPGTWKSRLADTSLAWYGSNLSEFRSIKSISEHALGAGARLYALPLVVHDLKDSKLIATLIEATAEGRAVVTKNSKSKGYAPESSILFTMNDDIADSLRLVCAEEREPRTMSRTVWIKSVAAFDDLSDKRELKLLKAIRYASGNVYKLLHVDDQFIKGFSSAVRSKMDVLRPILTEVNIQTGIERIARNWATIWQASETVVTRVAGGWTAQPQKLQEYIMEQLRQATKFYLVKDSGTTVPISSTSNGDFSTALKDLLSCIIQLEDHLITSEWEFLCKVIGRDGGSPGLAINKKMLTDNVHKLATEIDITSIILKIVANPECIKSKQVNIKKGRIRQTPRCIVVPLSLLEAADRDRFERQVSPQEPTDLTEPARSLTPGINLSDADRASEHTLPEVEPDGFKPPVSSTPNAKAEHNAGSQKQKKREKNKQDERKVVGVIKKKTRKDATQANSLRVELKATDDADQTLENLKKKFCKAKPAPMSYNLRSVKH